MGLPANQSKLSGKTQLLKEITMYISISRGTWETQFKAELPTPKHGFTERWRWRVIESYKRLFFLKECCFHQIT